jgi:large subunit ribosomal protein L52
MQQQMMRQQQFNPFQQQQMMRQQQFNPFQQQQMMRQQPFQQQQMMRQQPFQQQQMGGLQAALMQLLGQYNQPMQRQQFMPMPQYQNQALQYRPDMTQAQESLSRVAPSVQEQQRLAEEAAAKARSSMFGNTDEDAAMLEWQRQQYRNSQMSSGG